jgi:UDP-glucuronate decarboxylase
MAYIMETILITGGAGFIGSHLAEELLKKGYKVIVFDNLQTGKLENIQNFTKNPDFTFLKGNVNLFEEIAQAFEKFKFDYVFHYAACVGVKRTLENPNEVFADIKGFQNMLELSRDNNIKRILFSSSSEVYGESQKFPQNETKTPLNAKLPYAIVKNLGEAYLKSYQEKYGLDYTIFRFFNTYGPKQSDSFVVSKFIRQALTNKEITVYGRGHQTRAFIYVKDNVTACINALTNPKTINKVINVGNNKEVTIRKLAKLILKLTNSRSSITKLPPLAKGDMPRRVPDITLMLSLLRPEPFTKLESGLTETIKYFKCAL